MLVLQPCKRITIEQIKRHRWMMVEVMDMPVINILNNNVCGTAAYEPNDQILRIMQNLGIDAQRTRESLKVNIWWHLNVHCSNYLHTPQQTNSYDHYTAFYLLLLERLKNKDNNGGAPNGTPKHLSLESQRRRPSSIAEQAMRKLGLGSVTHQR